MRNKKLGMTQCCGNWAVCVILDFFYRVIFSIPKRKLGFVLLSCGKIFDGVRRLAKAEGNGETWTTTKWTSAAVGSLTAKVALYATFRGGILAERKLYRDLCEGERGDGESSVVVEAEVRSG